MYVRFRSVVSPVNRCRRNALSDIGRADAGNERNILAESSGSARHRHSDHFHNGFPRRGYENARVERRGYLLSPQALGSARASASRVYPGSARAGQGTHTNRIAAARCGAGPIGARQCHAAHWTACHRRLTVKCAAIAPLEPGEAVFSLVADLVSH